MLSNPLHRFSPYHTIPSTTLLSNGHVPNGHLHPGLDGLSQGSHYALQQLQQHVGVHNPHLQRGGPQPKHRQHPYGPAARATGAAGPIRRRISRACDQCNQLRTKCDGQHPCAHCIGKYPAVCLPQPVLSNLSRIWTRLRVHSRTQEAWQGFPERPGPTGCRPGRCRCRWSEVPEPWGRERPVLREPW